MFRAERLYLSMDAVRGCGDCPPCPGFKHGGTCPTEEVLSASCLLHDGTGIQSSHLFILRVNQNAPLEDEGQEEIVYETSVYHAAHTGRSDRECPRL